MAKINRELWVISFILVLSIAFAMSTGIRMHGDELSYYLMSESLLRDGNLVVEKEDIARWRNGEFGDSPYGTYIFIDRREVVRYGKPLLYPFIAVPFCFFGVRGLALLNGLFLGGSIIFCYLSLRRYLFKIGALFIVLMFFSCSFMPVYVFWMHPEMMLYFACSLCMWLLVCKRRTLLPALIIGIVSSMKIVFLLLLVPLIAVLISKKEFKKLNKAMRMCFLGIGIMLFLQFLFFGRISPYSSQKRAFVVLNSKGTYSTVQQEIKPIIVSMSQFEGITFSSLGLFFRNLRIFFIGRFTGVVWYAFPGIVCAGVYLLYRRCIQKQERILGDSILIAMLFLAVVLIIARPLNYFGGIDFICNRYFFILPAGLFLPLTKIVKNSKKFGLMFLPGLLVNFYIINYEVSEKSRFFYYRNYPYAYSAGLYTRIIPFFKYFPLELTQIESLPVHKIKVSENRSFYFPLGFKEKNEKGILIDKGQEIVIVQNSKENFILKTDRKNLSLKPAVKLKSGLSGEYKSFYYFKAKQLTLIK